MMAPGSLVMHFAFPGHFLHTPLVVFTAALITWALGLLAIRFWPERQPRRPDEPLISRRVLLGAGVSAGCGLVVIVYGNRVERYEVAINRVSVPLVGLPPELEGLKIALMADWHCGPYNRPDYLRKAVDLCNGCRPDLILLPGDFVSYKWEYGHEAAELLAKLKPEIPGGLFATWGNHDRWHNLADHPEVITGAGVRLLNGEKLQLTSRRDLESSPTGTGLWIAGVDDLWTSHPDIGAVLTGIPKGQPRIVMCHNPDVAEKQPTNDVDLMVSGHTHGGQIRLPLYGPPLVPSSYGRKYAQGWVDGPGYPVFVTCGVGVGGIPVRLGVPPEVVLLELHAGGLRSATRTS